MCKDTKTTVSVCKLKIQLHGDYFSDSDPVDLTVEGVVKIYYLGLCTCMLQELSSPHSDGCVDLSIVVTIASWSNDAKDGDMTNKADVGSIIASDNMSGEMLEYGGIAVSGIVCWWRQLV